MLFSEIVGQDSPMGGLSMVNHGGGGSAINMES